VKSFLVKRSIEEVLSLSKLRQREFIYSIKIDLPEELRVAGNKTVFQELVIKLLQNASKAYSLNNFQNKIILIVSKIENSNKVSLSVTSGGKGLSFLEKTVLNNNLFIFRERDSDYKIQQIIQELKKEFKGNMKVISRKNKGSTFKCYFPLNQ
jgi:light-regulated signal transduction histidine kinase (bacteriophytochrome)